MATAIQARCPSQSFVIFQSDARDHQQQRHQVGAPVVIGDGEAGFGLTSNFSSERKRRREEELGSQSAAAGVATASCVPLPGGMMPTSGRAPSASCSYHLNQLACEMEDIIQREQETKTALVEMTSRRYRWLVSILCQTFQERLKEKELELELVSKRNQELELIVKKLAAETQLWISYAKKNEAAAASLQATLDQVLRRPIAEAPGEGFGDNELCSSPAPEDERSSRCSGVDATQTGSTAACKSCGVSLACVLLLPCRHLCLCRECLTTAGACPVCNSVKSVAVEVLLS